MGKFLNRYLNVISLSIVLQHLFGLILALVYPPTWFLFIGCIVSYVLRGLGVTIGYHRMLSHKAFEAHPIVEAVFTFLGAAACQLSPISWAAVHRHHHKYSDTEHDWHAPAHKGFWYSHVGWIMDKDSIVQNPDLWKSLNDEYAPELYKNKIQLFFHKFHYIPPMLWAIAAFLIDGMAGFTWLFLISSIITQNITWGIISVVHWFGYKHGVSEDTAKQSVIMAVLAFGEGWHENHHAYPNDARNGMRWYEFDLSYLIIKSLAKLGLIKNIRRLEVEL